MPSDPFSILTLAQDGPAPTVPAAPGAPATPATPATPGADGGTTPPAGGGTTQQPAGATPNAGQATPDPWGFLFPMLLILAVFWVLLIMPQRKEKKKRAQMMSSIKKGDRIQTVGGVLGTVVELREHDVLVKVDEGNNTRLRFTRGAIHSVLPDGKPEES